MPETHTFIVDRYEGAIAVVALDGGATLDVPRWLLPRSAAADDVLAVQVEADAERAVIVVQRDADATDRAGSAARAAIERLKRRDRGGDVRP